MQKPAENPQARISCLNRAVHNVRKKASGGNQKLPSQHTLIEARSHAISDFGSACNASCMRVVIGCPRCVHAGLVAEKGSGLGLVTKGGTLIFNTAWKTRKRAIQNLDLLHISQLAQLRRIYARPPPMAEGCAALCCGTLLTPWLSN